MSTIEVDKIIPQSGTSTQLGESGDTITIPAGATITNNGTANGFGSADTEKVKVSSNDTTAGFLNGKLVAGTNISLTEGNDGGNETLTAALSGTIATTQIADDAVTLAKMAPGTDGNIISYDASGNPVAVATGSAGQVLTSAGAGAPPTFAAAGGITEVDMWQMSDQTYSHDDWIDTGWSRYNPNNLVNVPHGGNGLSESSGIFTFGSTGVYEILFQTYWWNPSATRTYLGVDVRGSTDGFASNYTRLGLSYSNTGTSGDHSVFTISCLYDVANTSNNKIRFQAQGAGSVGYYRTKLITKKLMDT